VSIVILVAEATAVALIVIVDVLRQLSQVFVRMIKYHQVLREKKNVIVFRGKNRFY